MVRDALTIADGYAARDRFIARARAGVVEVVPLPPDLPCVAWPLDVRAVAPDAPQALGDGWTGYADGAAYNPAADVTGEAWFAATPDRADRRQACRVRYSDAWWYGRKR